MGNVVYVFQRVFQRLPHTQALLRHTRWQEHAVRLQRSAGRVSGLQHSAVPRSERDLYPLNNVLLMEQCNKRCFFLVKGAWSCWSSWSQCSTSCGGGHYQRSRTCSNPSPAHSGDICIGLHTEEALCNTHECEGEKIT